MLTDFICMKISLKTVLELNKNPMLNTAFSRHTPPRFLPHTHTRKQRKVKNSTLECKENGQILIISDRKNVKKSKNRLTPLKLYSKKHDKKK